MICRCSNVGHQHKTKRREERPSRNVCKNTRKRFDRHLRRGGGGGGGGGTKAINPVLRALVLLSLASNATTCARYVDVFVSHWGMPTAHLHEQAPVTAKSAVLAAYLHHAIFTTDYVCQLS